MNVARPPPRSDRLAKRLGHYNPVEGLQMTLQSTFLEYVPTADLRRLDIFLTFISRRLAATDYQKALNLLLAAVSPSDVARTEDDPERRTEC
jgi:hypothetical protein